MQMTLTTGAQDMRHRFPHPEQCPRERDMLQQRVAADAYCVGGAVCRAAGLPSQYGHFPTQTALTGALWLLNPALDHKIAWQYAKLIATNNDAGCFARAWEHVENALRWQTSTKE